MSIVPIRAAPLPACGADRMATIGSERGELIDGDGISSHGKRLFDRHRLPRALHGKTAALAIWRTDQERPSWHRNILGHQSLISFNASTILSGRAMP